jgi:hypothetical protein
MLLGFNYVFEHMLVVDSIACFLAHLIRNQSLMCAQKLEGQICRNRLRMSAKMRSSVSSLSTDGLCYGLNFMRLNFLQNQSSTSVQFFLVKCLLGRNFMSFQT